MSYSFNWDCTLPISNINDIISINIVPQTKAYDEGDYLSLRGQISIDGEYTTTSGKQEIFKEYIPLDITLPNNGRGSEINTDITNFDYQVQDGSNLFLTLNLSLDGYDWESPITLVEEQENEVEVQTQAPVLFTKEAFVAPAEPEEQKVKVETEEAHENKKEVIEHTSATKPSQKEQEVNYYSSESEDEQGHNHYHDETDDLDYIDFDEVVLDHKEEAIDPKLAKERKESLTETDVQYMTNQSIEIKEPVVVEVVSEVPEEVEVVEQLTSQPVVEEVVLDHKEEAVDPKLAAERKESLTDKIKQFITKEPVEVKEPVVDVVSEVPEEVEVVETPQVEQLTSQPVVEEVVLDHKEEAVDPKLAAERKESLTDKIKQFITKEPVEVKEPVVDVVSEVPEEVEVVEAPQVEEVVEKVKPKPVAPIPAVSNVVKVEEEPAVTEVEEEEEILPFPLKEKEVVEANPVQAKKSDIFNMLYSLDETEPVLEEVASQPVVEEIVSTPVVEEIEPTVVVENEQVVQPQSVVSEEVEATTGQNQVISTYSSDDSIANQFLDGESILKIIFVQEEETTISNICTKYDVPEKAIYNLEGLNSPLHCGDRVMINYGKLR